MSDETTIKPSKKARAKAAITPALRFSPFLDVVIRRASSKASSVIESRISRDAVHIHPTNPNVLLVTPTCQRCKKLKRFCDRAGWTCSSCASSGISCSRFDRWDFYDAVDGKKVKHDSPASIGSRNDEPIETQEIGEPQIQCSFWASSLDEMRKCDPHCPSKGDPLGTSKLGAITALLLNRAYLQNPSRSEHLVADLIADTATFEKLQMAHIAAAPLRIYYLFGNLGRSCRVHNDSVANVKVFFVGICTISRIERQDGSLTEISLTLNRAQTLGDADKSRTRTAPQISDLLPFNGHGHTFLSFRCSVCGRANYRTARRFACCVHCSTSFVFHGQDAAKSLSRERKMELSFTGARSDLGQANMLLTNDDLTERSVSTFSDGTRVCTYHIASPATDPASSRTDKLKLASYELHHVLKRGRPDTASIEALLSPATPLQRLSLEAESKFRIRGYVLSLEAHTQGAYAGIVEQHSPLSVASEGLVCQIASLRQSLQIAAIAADVNARPGRFLGCVLLLLQDSQLKIGRSFFPAASAQFGLLCLAEPTIVSFRRDRPSDASTTKAAERGPKDISLGSFVMQPQDASVARTELLETTELELSASGISLWMIAHFAAEDTELSNSQPSPHENHERSAGPGTKPGC